jgi:hypothetical protein
MKKKMSKIDDLSNYVTVNGWKFELVKQDVDDIFYQCRGAIVYDDYHDQVPEPELWVAAMKLETILTRDGYNVNADHSEKGWVEVTVNV